MASAGLVWTLRNVAGCSADSRRANSGDTLAIQSPAEPRVCRNLRVIDASCPNRKTFAVASIGSLITRSIPHAATAHAYIQPAIPIMIPPLHSTISEPEIGKPDSNT